MVPPLFDQLNAFFLGASIVARGHLHSPADPVWLVEKENEGEPVQYLAALRLKSENAPRYPAFKKMEPANRKVLSLNLDYSTRFSFGFGHHKTRLVSEAKLELFGSGGVLICGCAKYSRQGVLSCDDWTLVFTEADNITVE